MQRAKYADPATFLHDLMNNPAVPLMMRKDAAKDLMPYKHARIGEKGKKEMADDDARKISRGTGSKFKTQKPPTNVTPIRRVA
jgi:phage terminase small subunit